MKNSEYSFWQRLQAESGNEVTGNNYFINCKRINGVANMNNEKQKQNEKTLAKLEEIAKSAGYDIEAVNLEEYRELTLDEQFLLTAICYEKKL